MSIRTEAVVIGAGVVGLAIARALAQDGRETILLEKAPLVGSETSSRNSEVIHAGIYYPPGSLKAALCVRGKQLLYDYLESRRVPHARCGKLIVAASMSERDQLQAIRRRALACGVDDLRLLAKREVCALEPAVRAEQGLLSPSTGIIDSHQFLLSLLGDFERAGGIFSPLTPVVSGRLADRGEHLVHTGGAQPASIHCRTLINCSGLDARDTWLRLAGQGDASRIPPQYFARGQYYTYPGKAPFSRLVYPLPARGGLGIHATLDMAGQVRFGPDVRWVDAVDYRFDDRHREQFVQAVRAYYPQLDPARLQPGYTGIRPKLAARDAPDADFLIATERDHGRRGFVSLHGIESPGLTASLAIAEQLLAALPPR